jgi:acyl dehydratase
MEHHIYFEDYEIGTTRTTFGRTITETDFVVHAGHTGDFFPHHMDAEFMKTQPFGQRIAHGTMVFAIGVGLTASRINPVAFIGDTIRTRLTIVRKEPDPKRPQHGRVWELTEVLNQREEVVLACEHIYIVQRGHAAPGNRLARDSG